MGHPNEKPKRPVPKSHQNSPQTARYGFMVKTAVMIFSFFYGLVGLLAIMWIMVTKRWALRKLSKAGKEELASARSRVWNLENQTHDHRFHTMRNGCVLHYVVSQALPSTHGEEGGAGLVVFLHGFPDSWAIWQPYLRSHTLREKATLVALDLPGYGGSGNLKKYTATEVLETITEFLVFAREEYVGASTGQVILVAHDWGAIIGFRLAAEAPQVADRFILSNGVHPPLAEANIRDRLASARRMFHTWTQSPRQLLLLRRAFSNIKPLLRQLSKSGYIFAFNLPHPLAEMVGSLGDQGSFWFLHFMTAMAGLDGTRKAHSTPAGFEHFAGALGPGEGDVESRLPMLGNAATGEIRGYPEEVRSRVTDGGFAEKIRLYRDGLGFEVWDKSLETVWALNQIEQMQQSMTELTHKTSLPANGGRNTTSSTPTSLTKSRSAAGPMDGLSSSATGSSPTSASTRHRRRSGSRVGVFELGPPGSLRERTTVVWGANDVAIENAVALEGLADYFGVRPSHLLVVQRCGHWVPVERMGHEVLEECVGWALEREGSGEGLGERVVRGRERAVGVVVDD